MGFANLLMLFGLGAVSLPILIHLLNRRRYDVVDWGAMQFLDVGETTRRRLLLEELLLLAVRMLVIALIVLGLAGPFIDHPSLAFLAGRANRDIVVLVDGSYSTNARLGKSTAHDDMRGWAENFVQQLRPGDRLKVVQAGSIPLPLTEGFTQDLGSARQLFAKLPTPRGGSDWPAAVGMAYDALAEDGRHRQREIYILKDRQQQGWADPATLFRWEIFRPQAKGASAKQPGDVPIRVVNFGARQSKPAANFALAPLTTPRTLAWPGQEVSFRSAILAPPPNQDTRPFRLRIEVNGQHVRDLPVPSPAPQVPLTFTHRFDKKGTQLVSLILDADPPADQQSPGHESTDVLPTDNRQDLVIEVRDDIRVLVVDGDAKLSPESSSYFLTRALSALNRGAASFGVQTHTVTFKNFDPGWLREEKASVLVLADVPTLTRKQQQGVRQFLEQGGGVLVAAGPRMQDSLKQYNDDFFQDGLGWLPGKLSETAGDLSDEKAASPDVKRFHHPLLEMFREEPNCALGQSRFPRWWQVQPAERARVWAFLNTGDPWLIQRAVGPGSVLLCTSPLDRAWNSNLPSIWEYPVLMHEIIYDLAQARRGVFNLKPGQPFRYTLPTRSDANTDAEQWTLIRPDGSESSHTAQAGVLSITQPGDAGIYRLRQGSDKTASVVFVVHADGAESKLAPCAAEDEARVAERMPMTYADAGDDAAQSVGTDPSSGQQDAWWLFLLGVIFLLCMEVWMTRRIALSRAPPASK